MKVAPLCLLLSLALVDAASADVVDSYHFSVRSAQSSVTTDVSITSGLVGTLIGNYDEANNPTGTRTIPGIFGPTSGNFPIDISGTAGLISSDTTHPAGSFTLTLDPETGLATVAGLELDLTASGGLAAVLGFTVEYQSFRTRQPTALFLGGIPITIPFGIFDLNSFTLMQTDVTGPGLLQPTGKNTYTVTLIAPVELSATIDSLLGDPIPIGPVLVPVPLVFDITLDGDHATALLSFEQAFAQDFPLQVDLPADQAIDLPTILPPGSTAHLLLNGSLDALNVDIALGATIDAAGQRQAFARADWDRNGVVNSADYYLFVFQFLTLGVDFNADGRSNSQDYFDYVVEYFSAR